MCVISALQGGSPMTVRSPALACLILLASAPLFRQTQRSQGPEHQVVAPSATLSPLTADEEDGLPFHGPLLLLTSPCTIDDWSKVIQWDGGAAEPLKHLHDPNPTTVLYTSHV